MVLTDSQKAAKIRVEAAGGKFIAPSKYGKMIPKQTRVLAKPNQIAAYSARKKMPSAFKKISHECASLVNQCLDPEEAASNPTRWCNTYGLSSIYACKNVINASFSEDNRCAVAVHPRLRNAIFTTAGNVFGPIQLSAGSPSVPIRAPFGVQDIAIASTQVVYISSPIYYRDRHVTLAFPNESTGGVVYPIGLTVPDGQTNGVFMELLFPQARSNQLVITCKTYGPTFGLISSAQYLSNASGVISVQLKNGDSGLASPSYFSMELETLAAPWQGRMNMTMLNSAAISFPVFYTLPNHAQHMLAYDIKDTDTIIENGEKSIIVAQSLLCTAQMSDLTNGGSIAIARVPGGTVIGEASGNVEASNWYEWLASLAVNNYDGAVKNGCYGWYLPDDERGFFYRDNSLFILNEQPYIAAEFTVNDATEASVVRIKVCSIVQFTSNSSTFAKGPSGVCYEIEEMRVLLSHVDACYSNGTHKEALKKHLKNAGNAVMKILSNPDNWKKAGEFLDRHLTEYLSRAPATNEAYGQRQRYDQRDSMVYHM